MQPAYDILSCLLATFKKVKLMSVMLKYIIIQYHILYSTKSITQNVII